MSNSRKAPGNPEASTIVTDFDVLMAEATYEPYRFTLAGKDRELPHLRTLTMAQLEALDTDFKETLTELADDELADIVTELPNYALEALVSSWFSHAGLSLGELLASARF